MALCNVYIIKVNQFKKFHIYVELYHIFTLFFKNTFLWRNKAAYDVGLMIYYVGGMIRMEEYNIKLMIYSVGG